MHTENEDCQSFNAMQNILYIVVSMKKLLSIIVIFKESKYIVAVYVCVCALACACLYLFIPMYL